MAQKFEMLIVDDDIDLASNLQDVLETEAYSTAVAHDGQTAFALCHKKAFDLAIIDIKLPDMSGVKLIQELAKLFPGTEYIISTGYASMETAVEAVGQKHIVAYETKPLNMDHLLALVKQVVERRQIETKMVEYEELDRLKSNLLSTVSHELRTPLSIIKGYSTMLVDYDRRLRSAEKRGYLESIDRATDRLTELVDHLLDLSLLDAGMLKLNKQLTSISKLIEEAVAEAKLRAPRHEIVLNLPNRLPMINIDAMRIRQVLDNTIDNAIKYSEEETRVVIEARRVGPEVQVSVADQGIGIPAEDLERVFDRMYRIEQRLSPEVGGVGLGLAICKGLVQQHGGRNWVESEPGKGSTFYFTVPVETAAEGHGHGEEL